MVYCPKKKAMECSLCNNNWRLKEWKAVWLKMQGPCSSGKRCGKKQAMSKNEEVKILESDFFGACHQSACLLVPIELLWSSLVDFDQISRQEKGLGDSEVSGSLEELRG